MAKPIPDGYHTVTASITFKDCNKAIDFYKKAFGAKALEVIPNLTGKGVMHATLQIGDTTIMMGDEMPNPECGKSAQTMGGSPVSFYIYVPNADASFKQAISAGAKEIMPVQDMFWGDRCGTLKDPFGLQWMIGTHKKDLSKEEVKKGAEEFFAQMAKK